MSSLSNRCMSTRRLLASALVCIGALVTTSPASAAAAVFLPRGSQARVDRHHVTVSLSAKGAVTWDAIDIAGTANVGLIVAVRAGGRVEVTGRAWIDLIEEATRVNVSTVPSGACTAIGTGGGTVSGNVDAGATVSGRAESSGGCNGGGEGESSRPDGGGGGCTSNSSTPSSGCGGCESCEPSEHGHPGCSAFAMTPATSGMGCGPADPDDLIGSSGTTPRPDSSTGQASRVGPYEMSKVSAADGSALQWLDDNGLEPGASFAEAAAAVERDGYELFAVRALPPTAASVVQSLRVVTSSPQATLPLRMLRMGSTSPMTPLTLVVLASTPQQLVDTAVMRIDGSRLASTGSTSNYESLVAALLGAEGAGDGGAAPDGGVAAQDSGTTDAGGVAQGSRWVLESSRPVTNRLTARSSASNEGGASEAATLADLFRTRCGEKTAERHAICTQSDDDGGLADAAADAADADPDAAPPDAGTPPDSGTPLDGGTTLDAGESDAGDCPDNDRQRCDDIDLAIPESSTLIATRFRAVLGGDPAAIADLRFAASTDALPDGRYVVRNDGQPGLCEPGASSDVDPATSGDDSQTCRQTARRPRPWSHLNLGPLVTLLVAIRIVAVIMRRAKRS